VKCDRRKERTAREHVRLELSEEEFRDALGIGPLGDDETTGERPSGTHRFVIAGFGGQGVLSLGLIMGRTAMHQGRYVSWLPSYGPEMRGGTANCHVVLSDERIGSPLVSVPTVAVAFNQPSLEKFGPQVEAGGTVIYDSSFVKDPWDRSDVNVYRVPFSSMANELGSAKVMNMVALGAINAVFDLFTPEMVEAQIRGMGKPKLVEVNLKAFQAGAAAVRKEVAVGG
jgi:2-oxoglutarate ferredoxin oxidoreductase subunit gamma